LLLLLIIGGCSRPPQIVVIVPNDFRGVVKLRGKNNEGITLGRSTTVTLPESGDLSFKGQNPIYARYHWELKFADGRIIPFFKPDGSITKDAVAFRHVGGATNDEVWFVVGTYADTAQAQERLRGFPWPPETLRAQMNEQPNQPDAVNPAIAPRFHVESTWRGVTDPHRSTKP
jgi:hypothetical protein